MTGGSTTLTATLSGVSSGTVPGGTVVFYDGTTAIGNGALVASGSMSKVTVTPTFSAVGAHSITASYSGDGNYNALVSTASTLAVTGTPAITLGVVPAAVTLGPGASTSTPLATVTPLSGFIGAVTLNCASPVAYLTCTAVSPTLTVTGATSYTSNVTISVAATVAVTSPAPLEVPRTTWLATLLPLAFFGRKRRKLRGLLVFSFCVAMTLLSGCSGGTTATTTSPKLPPAGTQTVTLTAIGSAATITAPITVTVTN